MPLNIGSFVSFAPGLHLMQNPNHHTESATEHGQACQKRCLIRQRANRQKPIFVLSTYSREHSRRELIIIPFRQQRGQWTHISPYHGNRLPVYGPQLPSIYMDVTRYKVSTPLTYDFKLVMCFEIQKNKKITKQNKTNSVALNRNISNKTGTMVFK